MFRGHSITILCFYHVFANVFLMVSWEHPWWCVATEPPNSWMVSQNGQLIRMGLTLVISGWWFLGKILWKFTPCWASKVATTHMLAARYRIKYQDPDFEGATLPTIFGQVGVFRQKKPWEQFAMDWWGSLLSLQTSETTNTLWQLSSYPKWQFFTVCELGSMAIFFVDLPWFTY